MVYPSKKNVTRTATVKTRDGATYEGKLVHQDDFNVSIVAQDGWIHTWPTSEVTVDVHDPLVAHRELTAKYTDADIHNLFAYLETLK